MIVFIKTFILSINLLQFVVIDEYYSIYKIDSGYCSINFE